MTGIFSVLGGGGVPAHKSAKKSGASKQRGMRMNVLIGKRIFFHLIGWKIKLHSRDSWKSGKELDQGGKQAAGENEVGNAAGHIVFGPIQQTQPAHFWPFFAISID
jgi:hypothetical protein